MSNKISLSVFIVVLVCTSFTPQFLTEQFQDGVKWNSISQIDSLQSSSSKKILVDVYTSWCAPCKKMDEYTFKDKRIAKYINENFIPIKFDGESKDTLVFRGKQYFPTAKTHELTKALEIAAYPTLIFFDEDGNLITKEAKFFSPNEMEIALHYINGNHYKRTSYSLFKSNYEF